MLLLHFFPLPLYSLYPSLFFIVEHGLEGGLVGGLCDWFAVWKTYNAIETDSNKVSIEIGKWVSKDLLNKNTLRAQLNRIIEEPENQKEIIALIETYFDTQENTKKILDDFWAKIETPVINYIVNYNWDHCLDHTLVVDIDIVDLINYLVVRTFVDYIEVE